MDATTSWPGPGIPLPSRVASAPAPGTTLHSHYRHCYGCGPDAPGGLRVQVVAGEGLTVSGRFTVTEDHQGAPGLAHGGLLATAMDEVLGSLNWLLMSPAVTASMSVDFRTPVPVGVNLHLQAQVVGQEGRKVYSTGTAAINGPDGRLAISARALFVQVGLEHFAAHGRPDEVAAARLERRPWLEINP